MDGLAALVGRGAVPPGSEVLLSVAFSKQGIKRLDPQFAKLEKV